MVETAGVEPAVPEAADLQSTGVTNFPTSPLLAVHLGIEPSSFLINSQAHTPCLLMYNKTFGAPRETRTLKIWLLRPTRIPIPSSGRKNIFESTVVCLVGSFKVLPPDLKHFNL